MSDTDEDCKLVQEIKDMEKFPEVILTEANTAWITWGDGEPHWEGPDDGYVMIDTSFTAIIPNLVGMLEKRKGWKLKFVGVAITEKATVMVYKRYA